jgi:uncharacterized membrane protein YfcA
MAAGIGIAARTPERRLRNAFGVLVLGVAAVMAWQVIAKR